MTKAEQHEMVERLRDYVHLMKGRDLDEFEMLRKRDRDDEDFDQFARRTLADLMVRYVPERFRR